jgi:hypothetical protein
MVDEGQSEARRDASLFQIIYVPDDAIEQTEAMGTKRKFWYEDEDLGLCLFKHSRHDAGEDWAEKMAEQVCDLLGIPHARYELAVWNGQRGVVTPRFTGDEERLIPGNELLMELDPTYPAHASSARLKVPQHTLLAVERVMADPAVGIPSGFAADPTDRGSLGRVHRVSDAGCPDRQLGSSSRELGSRRVAGSRRDFLAPAGSHPRSWFEPGTQRAGGTHPPTARDEGYEKHA